MAVAAAPDPAPSDSGVIYFLNLFLHVDKHLATLIQTYGAWVYAVLFVIVFLETGVVVTPLLPGDSLLFAAGTLAAAGSMDVVGLFMLLTVAAILGDTVNYSIGRAVGARAFSGNFRFLKKEYLERTQQFYDRHGRKTIVLARFVPIIRTFAPFVAGVGAMSYGVFVVYNVVGGAVWCAVCVFSGYFFGNLPLVKNNFTAVILLIIFLSILPAIIEFIQTYRRRAAAH